jgi:hypothetical protein
VIPGIVALCAVLASAQGQAPQQSWSPSASAQAAAPSASALVSKMFALYAGAHSLQGTIRMTQSVPGTTVTLDTTLAFEAPSKLFIRQMLNSSSNPRQWLVTSDGQLFTYDYPDKERFAAVAPRGRLLEAVVPSRGHVLDYREIYRAAALSLGDRSVPLDLAIAGSDELQAIRDQIATVQVTGKQKLGDENLNVVAGDWREYGNAPASGTFQMLITDDGQLRRYSRKEMLAMNLPNGLNVEPKPVTTVWDVRLELNPKIDPVTFSVVK